MRELCTLIVLTVALALATDAWAVAPAISSFAPTSAPVSATRTITGSNFETTPANDIVYFGAAKTPSQAIQSPTLLGRDADIHHTSLGHSDVHLTRAA